MHEWALAEAVLEELKKYTKPHISQKIVKAVLLFGELQAVDPDVFNEGLKYLLPEADIEAEIEIEAFSIETDPAGFTCRNCGREWLLKETPDLSDDTRESIHFLPETVHSFVSCPKCESADFTISRGRGVTIKAIEILELTAP